MENLNNDHFIGKQDDEEVISMFRRHWIVMLTNVTYFLLFIILVLIGFLYIFNNQIRVITGSSFSIFVALLIYIFSLYVIHRFFIKFINHYLNTVVITNYRLVEFTKTVILNDSKDAIDLIKVQDIIKKQEGLVKNILNYGSLIITISAVNTTKIMDFIPDPDYYFRVLNKAKREQISSRQNKNNNSASDIERFKPASNNY